jgi:hypothetical protein
VVSNRIGPIVVRRLHCPRARITPLDPDMATSDGSISYCQPPMRSRVVLNGTECPSGAKLRCSDIFRLKLNHSADAQVTVAAGEIMTFECPGTGGSPHSTADSSTSSSSARDDFHICGRAVAPTNPVRTARSFSNLRAAQTS